MASLKKFCAKLVWGILRRLLIRALDHLRTSWLEHFLGQLVSRRTNRLPPEEALRFLFRLDAAFYPIQGAKAVEYDGGIHTKHRHTRYHDFFVNRIRPEERVLDIGCGIGVLAYDVADRAGAQVWGIDLNEAHIARARSRYHHPRVRYLVGDVLQELPGESFDVVILSNVLEHLEERPQFLRRLLHIIQPCRILVRVPLLERDWRVPLKMELGVEWRLDGTHEVEYTPESFAEEMAVAGLSIVYQEMRWGEIWAEIQPMQADNNQS